MLSKHMIKTVLLLTTLTFFAGGCVAQKERDDLQALYRRSQEQVLDLRAQLKQANAALEALRSSPTKQDPALLTQLQSLTAERDALLNALEQAKQALLSASQTVVLPPQLNQALINLAEANPKLMQYDEKLGMLKLHSDLTFALGSANVNSNAKASLDKLAEIIKKPIAAGYELRIAGHTDNVRISRPATRAKHPTNWHLSVHRAIAVKDIIEKDGVSPTRLVVIGYGENRPIKPNGTKGEAANRRVEIFLAPSTYTPPANTNHTKEAVTETEAKAADDATQQAAQQGSDALTATENKNVVPQTNPQPKTDYFK